MATRDVTDRGVGERYDTASTQRTIVRFYDETKAAIKSTEFYAYLVTFAGILIAAQVISDGDSGTGVKRRRLQREPCLALPDDPDGRLHGQPRARKGRQRPS